MKKISTFILLILLIQTTYSQNFGDFPKIAKEKLHRDLDLLYQGLDKFHSGMYWYTPKDSVDFAFQTAKNKITNDLNVYEFHKIIAPLVALSREDHTDIFLPKEVKEQTNKNENIRFLPLTVVFLGEKLYCVKNASNNSAKIENLEIEKINGETPKEIVTKIGILFASDGYIKSVKYSDLGGFNFSKNYFYYYGIIEKYEVKFKEITEPITINSLSISQINENLKKNNNIDKEKTENEPLQFKIINAKTAYLDIQTFSNDIIKRESKYKTLKKFLKQSFSEIKEHNIKNVIIDVRKNGGGTEGNEGLLYSYFGDNYQKYSKVRVKTQKAILNNGIDKPIKLKVFGFLERIFVNKKMKDGSLERKNNLGLGLMAYKKAPKDTFKGNVYVLISPITYSGGSEFSNMMYSQGLATFIGQETGGGYYGNTSGYSQDLTLPNSKITIEIPALQFVMNVEPKLPFGSGVKPNYEVIPTINQYINNENIYLEYALKLISEKQ
jgi:C-terminal processing protease CtpA/Prc